MAEHEAERRVLEGVPELRWGKSGDCTFVGALAAACAVTEFPCDYTTVMGATGLAFRTRWFSGPAEARWCPSSPVGELLPEIRAARRATGWALRVEWDNPPLARLTPDIVRAIDAGLPALAYDESLNMAVLCGYEDGGRTALLQTYAHEPGLAAIPTADLKMMVIFLDDHTPPLSPLEAAEQGIAMGLASAQRGYDAAGDGRGYWLGPAALAQWREDVAAADACSDEDRKLLFFVSWWNFEALADARRRAVAYLDAVAALFPPEAADALLEAAEHYRSERSLLDAAFAAGDAFQGPWLGECGGDAALWTRAARERECEILSAAAGCEEQALAALRRSGH